MKKTGIRGYESDPVELKERICRSIAAKVYQGVSMNAIDFFVQEEEKKKNQMVVMKGCWFHVFFDSEGEICLGCGRSGNK